MNKTKYEIKRVAVFSVVKTLFLLGGFSGFVLGLVHWVLLRMFWLMGLNAVLDPAWLGQPEAEQVLGDMVGAIGILLPFMGAIGGAVSGVVAGFLLTGVYNLGARIWGGIEVELEASAPVAPPLPLGPARAGEPTPLPGSPDSRPSGPPSAGSSSDDERPPRGPSSAMYE